MSNGESAYDIVDRFINIYKDENTESEDTKWKVDTYYDTVDKPVGYNSGCMETKEKIKIMLDDKDLLPSQSFNLGNVIKYIDRHQLKGSALEDIEKAIGYLTMYKNSLREDD